MNQILEAKITPRIKKVMRQPYSVINQATTGKENAAPRRDPEKFIPVTIPLSFKGIQLQIALDMPGKAPASPAPNKKRTINNDIKFHAKPVKAVKIDQIVTIDANIFLGPKRSTNIPDGV